MIKSTVKELEQQLAVARAEEAKTEAARYFEEIREQVEGRAFIQTSRQPGWSGIYLIKYGKVTRDSFRRHPVARYRTISVIKYSENGGFEIHRKRPVVAADFDYGSKALLYKKPLDVKVFDALWKRTVKLGDLVSAAIAAAMKEDLDTEPYDPETERQQEFDAIDVPVVTVEPRCFDCLPAAYKLRGYRYLKTPESVRLAIKAIRAEQDRTRLGAEYFEAADWRHVEAYDRDYDKLIGELTK